MPRRIANCCRPETDSKLRGRVPLIGLGDNNSPLGQRRCCAATWAPSSIGSVSATGDLQLAYGPSSDSKSKLVNFRRKRRGSSPSLPFFGPSVERKILRTSLFLSPGRWYLSALRSTFRTHSTATSLAMATEIIYRETRRRYRWPEVQLNLWILLILAAAATDLGIFAWFITVQEQMRVGIPWLFPYTITVAGLTLLFLLLMLILASRRLLIPGIILLGSFILFALWLTALIETAIQLYGPAGDVNSNCSIYVTDQVYKGVSVETLAWLTQNNICNCWKAAFAFEVVASVLFFWMMILSWQVQNDNDD